MVPFRVLSGYMLCAALTLVPRAWAEPPSTEELKAVRAKLDEAQRALTTPKLRLEEADREKLATRLVNAEAALALYEKLSKQSGTRSAAVASLYAAGGIALADDATGVGAVDDVLLPFIALGLLATQFSTRPAQSQLSIDMAWANVLMSLQTVAQVAQEVSARRRKEGCYCKCFKKGVGALISGRKENAAACAEECKEANYPGYQCGGAVIWIN